MIRTEKGITLIALVVTIVVLLILAGIGWDVTIGENGIMTKAKEAKIAQAHAEVNDSITIQYADYQIEGLTAKKNISFFEYLVSNDITDSNGVVNVQKLLGTKMEFGNGIGNADVYKIENILGNYILKYYDKKGTATLLHTYGEDVATEPVDKTALKFLVNSGDDGIVQLPIDRDAYGEGGYEVDWGDGTKGKDGTSETAYYKGILHTYAEKNKEYEVSITGHCYKIDYYEARWYRDRIIEVLQWGETGLQSVMLDGYSNLRKIAIPTKNSFISVVTFGFEGCENLVEIPTDLFSNCPSVTGFRTTFARCTSLTSIPADLFSNCPNVTDFRETFAGCSQLTGVAPELWKRVPDGETKEYIGVPDGEGCFSRCEGLSNYGEVPEYWKKEVEDS